jgi:hypothetical protein
VLHTVLEDDRAGRDAHRRRDRIHVIESFRNGLWAGYKTARDRAALWNQFHPLERASMHGRRVWPMVELEADDALASSARFAAADERVEKDTAYWTPDKDLAHAWSTIASCRWIVAAAKSSRCAGVKPSCGVVPRSFRLSLRW